MRGLIAKGLARRVRRRVAPGPTINANIFFMHIPKCGGSSITRAIGERFPVPRQGFSLPAVPSTRAAALAGRNTLDFRRDVLLLAFAQLQGGYIRGHFPFSVAAWKEFHDQWQFITVLRDPVRRWFSSYFFNRFRTHHNDAAAIDEDLEDFVDTPRAGDLGTAYVRLLSEGAGAGTASDQTHVDEAIANLEKFDLVGTLEQLPDFVARFRQAFSVPIAIGRRNESPLSHDRRKEMITPRIRSHVEGLCEPDMQVYQHALRMNRAAANT